MPRGRPPKKKGEEDTRPVSESSSCSTAGTPMSESGEESQDDSEQFSLKSAMANTPGCREGGAGRQQQILELAEELPAKAVQQPVKDDQQHPQHSFDINIEPVKRGRGRPKGVKNKVPMIKEGLLIQNGISEQGNASELEGGVRTALTVESSTDAVGEGDDIAKACDVMPEVNQAKNLKTHPKSWTESIWGSKNDQKPEKQQTDESLGEVKMENNHSSQIENKVEGQSRDNSCDGEEMNNSEDPSSFPKHLPSQEETPVVSESSTPSGGSRSISPDNENHHDLANETNMVTSRKSSRIRKPVASLESEDSQQSVDLATAKSGKVRIPRRKKEEKGEVPSPGEEMPLIPKGFMEQKKKLEEEKLAIEGQVAKSIRMMGAEEKKEIEAKLKSFRKINENHYMCARKVNKQSKKMQCDCTLTKEEMANGEKGCGDDCLNRLLFIECGKGCQLDSLCRNKRFQNLENAAIEVFKTEWKGFGIRALAPLPRDTFLMEYVGEVLDNKQFRKRARQYSREEVQHFYFMALSKEFYVDATSRGNISRFINHSCNPNSETQKWTVNGELRVGFFTTREVQPGEELTFDYKYERYGNIAQKCYCGASNCRGWLGGEPTSDSGIEEMEEWTSSEEEGVKDEEEEAKKAEEKKKRKKMKKPKKLKQYEEDEYEDEIEGLAVTGIRNKIQTVQLCRLMVRATRQSTRLRLIDLLLEADQPCLRLFLDYQGLRILSHWMFELEFSIFELELKLRIETALATLSIPHKTMLVDSKVLQTVEQWSRGKQLVQEVVTPSISPGPSSPKSRERSSSGEPAPPGDDPEPEPITEAKVEDQPEVGAGADPPAELTEEDQLVAQVKEKALELLESWSLLKEVFKIPKKERQAERIKHERAADLGWHRPAEERILLPPANPGDLAALQQQARAFAALQLAEKAAAGSAPSTPSPQVDRRRRDDEERSGGASRGLSYNKEPASYNRDRESYNSPGGALRGGYQGGRGREGGGGGGSERRNLRLDDRTGRLAREHLHRDDRRQLFQAKVEEEQRQKVLRASLSARHTQCCRLLGLSAPETPLLPQYPDFYLAGGKWLPMPSPPLPVPGPKDWVCPKMVAKLPFNAYRSDDPPPPDPRLIYPPGVCPEEREPTPPPPRESLEQEETYEEVCQFYDRLFYRGEAEGGEEDDEEDGAEDGDDEGPSRSPSPPAASKRPRLASTSPSPLPSPSPPGSATTLSPDYRSPSPAPRPATLVTPPLPQTPPPSEALTQPQVLQADDSPTEKSPPPIDNGDFAPSVPSPSYTSPLDTIAPLPPSLEAMLRPKWRAARDSSNRIYYYHKQTKVTQWEVPWADPVATVGDVGRPLTIETGDTDTEEERGEDGEDTDTEDDSEDEDVEMAGETTKEDAPEEQIPDSDLSASEKRMLMRMRGRTKEERSNMRRMKKERYKERREQERLVSRERHTRHRRDGLVVEHIVPARVSDKDKADLMTFKEMRERLLNKDKIREQQLKEEREEEEKEAKERREERAKVDKASRERKRAAEKAKREAEFRQLALNSSLDSSGPQTPVSSTMPSSTSTTSVSSGTPVSSRKTTQAAADTSSDVEKKHKDKFVKEMSKVVVKILDPYRKKGVRGHIGNTTDFKHLAKKLTYTIMHKELKQCKSIEELKATDKVKKKASEYASKYMKKFEREYKRSPGGDD